MSQLFSYKPLNLLWNMKVLLCLDWISEPSAAISETPVKLVMYTFPLEMNILKCGRKSMQVSGMPAC